MSGKRTKAIRRELAGKLGRSPRRAMTHDEPRSILLRGPNRLLDKTVRYMQMVVDKPSEFRTYKKAYRRAA